jgi:hypothetical protein
VIATIATTIAALASAAPAADDIRDIRGPIIAAPSHAWWPYVLIVACIAAIAIAVRTLSRRRRRALPPDKIAMEQLERARHELEADNAHAFSICVSDTVREYVEHAFAVHAPTRTTFELLHELMDDGSPLGAHRNELGSFLEYCDLAKYARSPLSRDQMTGMLESARAFVQATAAEPTAKGVPA